MAVVVAEVRQDRPGSAVATERQWAVAAGVLVAGAVTHRIAEDRRCRFRLAAFH